MQGKILRLGVFMQKGIDICTTWGSCKQIENIQGLLDRSIALL
jgi:hypothetical protein